MLELSKRMCACVSPITFLLCVSSKLQSSHDDESISQNPQVENFE